MQIGQSLPSSSSLSSFQPSHPFSREDVHVQDHRLSLSLSEIITSQSDIMFWLGRIHILFLFMISYRYVHVNSKPSTFLKLRVTSTIPLPHRAHACLSSPAWQGWAAIIATASCVRLMLARKVEKSIHSSPHLRS
jgi:hypothetical protein